MKYVTSSEEGLLNIITSLKCEIRDLEGQIELWKTACDNLDRELKDVKEETKHIIAAIDHAHSDTSEG